jgi:hypothetical protein
MSRDLVAAFSGALDDDAVSVFWACDLEFDSPSALHLWSGYGSLDIDGTTYTGAGHLMNISEVQESSDIAAYGAKLTLSGIPSEYVSLARTEPYQGRRARVKFGVEVGGTKYFINVFSGEMDQLNIEVGPDTATITVEVESRLVDLKRPRVRRYTDADQKAEYPDDLAFEFVTRLQDEVLEWQPS